MKNERIINKNMNEIRILIDRLNHYTDLYNKDNSPISDKDWDNMYFQLQELEKTSGVIYPDSPTQKIRYNEVTDLKKVVHDHPMLSLDKTKEKNVIKAFLKNQPFVAMFKLDGLTCSLTYENGKLIKAETRGNGIEGEDILHNAQVLSNIPQTIHTSQQKIVIDGEVICKYGNFKYFESEYKNPRNFASGSIRLLSSEECAKRKLSFVAWDLIEGYSTVSTFEGKLLILEGLGFETVPYIKLDKWNDSVFDIMDERPEHFMYPIDGFVFKFDNLEYGEKQGRTEHHFKNAIAFKKYDELYESRLRGIEWSMGKTGVLTPVAYFEPIKIDGTTIEKASLHNVNIMREIFGDCAYVGQYIKVFKANMIIPQIAEAYPKMSYGEVIAQGGVSANDVIEYCPYCHSEVDLIKSPDGTLNYYCSSPLCDGKLLNKLDHFCGKKGLDIKGISKATISKLIDEGWLSCYADVFSLKNYRLDWIKMPGFGIASVDKILKSIEEHKTTTLAQFLAAISIPLIGTSAAKELASYFNNSYKDFRSAVDNPDFCFFSIPNFGTEMHKSIKQFNYEEADTIIELLIITNPKTIEKIQNNKLNGKNIVITGKLTHFKNRAELKEKILQCGGKVSESITSKTSLLINNDVTSSSAKNKAAQKQGIPILSENDFITQYLENN